MKKPTLPFLAYIRITDHAAETLLYERALLDKSCPHEKKTNKKDIFFSLHNPHRIKLIQVTRLKSKDKIAKIWIYILFAVVLIYLWTWIL